MLNSHLHLAENTLQLLKQLAMEYFQLILAWIGPRAPHSLMLRTSALDCLILLADWQNRAQADSFI